MTAEAQPNIDSPATTDETSETRIEKGSARPVAIFLGCLAVALIVVVVVVILNPPGTEALSPSRTADNASGGPAGPSLSPPGPAGAPQSTVWLPSVQVSATAEQLQQEAERVAEALREAYPQRPEALHVAAMLASQLRRSEDAEKLWSRCIELDPKQTAYYVNLGAIAMDRGDSQLAVDTLEKAIEAGCVSGDVYHHLSIALTKLGRCEEAEATIQKALTQYPQSGAYWLVLGQAQLKGGKAAEAEASLRKAIELGSATSGVYFALANACARQDKKDDAAKYRELFAEMKAETPMDKQQRFRILSTAESQRTAVTILCEAAAVHGQQKNLLESERLLLRAVALDPASPGPCRLLADLYQSSGMLVEAKTVWSRLIEIEPYEGASYVMLAQCCARLGEPQGAEAALKLGLAVRPEAVDAYAVLAEFYGQRGNAAKARWYAQEAIRREASVEGYEFLAKMCRALGDEAAAGAAEGHARELSAREPVSPKAPAGEQP